MSRGDEGERERRMVFGVQPVREVLRAHEGRAHGVWLLQGPNPKLDGLARLAASKGVSVERVPRGELDRRTKNGMHQGALALAPPLEVLDDAGLFARVEALIEASPPPIVLILDGVMDPQNFGAVVRATVALAGDDAVIVWPEHGAAPLTPATFRASAGAIEHATLARVRSLPTVLQGLRDRGFTTVLLEGSADRTVESIDLKGPVAIVLGAEDKGAKPAVRKAAEHHAKLPMSGVIDSLNASVAAALALYETGRQRRSK